MEKITANTRTYNLLSDILKIAGEYPSEELKKALNHVSLTSKGDYHDIMVTLLKNFELLNNLPSCQPDSDKPSEKADKPSEKADEPSEKADEPSEKAKKPSPQKGRSPSSAKSKSVSEEESKIKELRAMLEDTDFISAKKDAIKIIKNYYKDTVTLRPDNKDSKRDLIAKIISVQKKMQGAEKQKIYSALRRAYLKSQKSDL